MFPRSPNLNLFFVLFVLRSLILASIGLLAMVTQNSPHDAEAHSKIAVTVVIILHCGGGYVLKPYAPQPHRVESEPNSAFLLEPTKDLLKVSESVDLLLTFGETVG